MSKLNVQCNQGHNVVPSVNFHLWKPCNMRCKFCFSTFEGISGNKGINCENATEIIRQLSRSKIKKITFVGGEPTLCPWLDNLLFSAKSNGLTTMIVTNGSRLNKSWLQSNSDYIDWITLSVDSLDKQKNLASGRVVGGDKVLSGKDYHYISEMIKQFGIRLKLNTVVSAFNQNENMTNFLLNVKPERWKIFQVLPINGQNDIHRHEYLISHDQFEKFIQRHLSVREITNVVVENNDAMTGSYLMIDPAGRFFDNIKGYYTFSQPIYEVGFDKALSQISIDVEKFIARDGIYDWG